MKKLCVFCGSSEGKKPIYRQSAEEIGMLMAQNGIGLVYGGGAVGIMGRVANSVLSNGGKVWGAIPKALDARELSHKGVTELYIVDTMHERKKLMYDLSDGFLILPGGIGTLDEFFEVFTWAQLGIHSKPFYIYNVDGFYSGLISHINQLTDQGFLDSADLLKLVSIETIDQFKSVVLDNLR